MALRFPGMDPYLEAPDLWPGFHEAFLFCLREALQPILPAKFYAELRTREEVGIAGFPSERAIFPDVAVKETGSHQATPSMSSGRESGSAVPEHLLIAESEPLTVGFLEVREVGRHGRLVTLIELLSPSNKRSGADRESFERKQQEIFASDVNWVEIDLLRAGRRLGGHWQVDEHCCARGWDYVVVVSRALRRRPRLDLELYGFTVRDPFPAVAIPLSPGESDVTVELAAVFKRAYETGPYAKIIDYGSPPDAFPPP